MFGWAERFFDFSADNVLRLLEQTYPDKKLPVSRVCVCGAVSVELKDKTIMLSRTWLEAQGYVVRKRRNKLADYCCCDRCVNHRGPDLCPCGNGEPVESCAECTDRICE